MQEDDGYYLITFANRYSANNEAWVAPAVLGDVLPGLLRDVVEGRIWNVRVCESADGNETAAALAPAREQVTANTASRVRTEYYSMPPYVAA